MTANATLRHSSFPREQRFFAAAALAAGLLLQMPDGKAGVRAGLNAAASGDAVTTYTDGIYSFPKTASIVLLKGGKAYWDRANSAVTFKAVTGGYYLGVVAEDAAASDTTCEVDINAQTHYRIAWGQGGWDTAVVLTAGTVIPNPSTGLTGTDPGGSGARFTFSATAEAQKVDAMSRDVVAIADGPILEARLASFDKGDAAALDVNIGLANGTHATDADSITEHVFFHLDGNSLVINAQSKDGTTTVAAATTTVSCVDDTYFEVWIDGRDSSNVKLYIDGVRVNAASTFKLNAGTGPMKALFHMEKTADDTLADYRVEFLRVRSTDLA